jgi:hypothetical protein
VADEFSDFRIPAHRARLWTVGLNGFTRRQDHDNDLGSDRLSRGDAQVGTQGYRLWDSDPRRTQFSATASATGATQRVETTQGTGHEDRRARIGRESWSFAVDDRHYPWSLPVGIVGSAGVAGEYAQEWDHIARESSDRSIRTLDANQRWDYETIVRAQVACGWGRVRDATPVMEARYLEARLRESGVLARDLSGAARMHLAQLLSTRSDFGAVADRPARSLWKEIHEVLRADGALADGADDPGAWARAFEPYFGPALTYTNIRDLVPESPIARATGVFVGPVLGYDHSDRRTRVDSKFDDATYAGDVLVSLTSFTSSGAVHFFQDTPTGGIEAEVHRPLGLDWQADAVSRFVVPLRERGEQLTFTSNAALGYLRLDRWSAAVTAFHERDIVGGLPGPVASRWLAAVGGRVDFYMEDHLALTLRAEDTQSRSGASGASEFNRALSAGVSLTYRITGAFDAPGLFSPRLGRP